MTTYQEYIEQKKTTVREYGFDPDPVNPMLFPFQREIEEWAVRRGRAAIFADCGLGKTPLQLEWASQVVRKAGPVLILAPLAVSRQTRKEGEKFGYEVNICREQGEVGDGINITNYERLHRFNPGHFAGVVLDESSPFLIARQASLGI